MGETLSRREFLFRTGAVALGASMPSWVGAFAQPHIWGNLRGKSGRRVLVVCQLSGGNDGLNTLVPFRDARYYALRPTLAVPSDAVLDLGGGLGMNPVLRGLHSLFQSGRVAAIQSVGYPNPNRSHFRSTEIWHTADPDGKQTDGWLGRSVEHWFETGRASDHLAVGLAHERPMALVSHKTSIRCVSSLAEFEDLAAPNTVGDTGADRPDARFGPAADPKAGEPNAAFGHDAFGSAFKQASQVIAAASESRLVFLSIGGFDTHARQAANHNRLLRNLGDALNAFDDEMAAIGMAEGCVVLVFSEFGRRAFENASMGTDHGAAGPVLLMGGGVKGGVYGPNPDLSQSSDGDIPYQTDFRAIYADTLRWMDVDPKPILGCNPRSLGLFGH